MNVGYDQFNRRGIYRCDNCGKQSAWGDTWVWFGSYGDLDDGRPVIHGCTMKCAKAARKKMRAPEQSARGSR